MMNLANVDGEVNYIKSFYTDQKANRFFKELETYIQYEQRNITLFGKQFKSPRLEAFFTKENQVYSYSGTKLESHAFTTTLKEICQDLERFTNRNFNSVLVNVYRNGSDGNGWHADDEKELGENPFIASLSLGETRKIKFRHKVQNHKFYIEMQHGSLLVMKGSLQHHWKHHIPKTKKEIGKRINLTFRSIKN